MNPENIDHASFNVNMKVLISGVLSIESVLMFSYPYVNLKCHFLFFISAKCCSNRFQKYSYFHVTTLILLYINTVSQSILMVILS